MPYENNIDLNANNLKNPDINFLAPNAFKLVIDNTTYQNVQYLVQTASIPDISLSPAPTNSMMRNIGAAGDKITYSPLELTFLVDENLKNYREIHDWIIGQLTKNSEFGDGKVRDVTLMILSSHNNVVQEIQFVDAYPISLSSLTFESNTPDINYLTASVTFEYSYYKLL
jgi:hypothetical protein